MKKILLILFLVELAIPAWVRAQTNVSSTTGQTVETIVCVRHGEKPPGGLGQLNCRGLNRSLALPDVLLKKFGVPQFIFAPNPTEKVEGKLNEVLRAGFSVCGSTDCVLFAWKNGT
jgi:hypothetical protein